MKLQNPVAEGATPPVVHKCVHAAKKQLIGPANLWKDGMCRLIFAIGRPVGQKAAASLAQIVLLEMSILQKTAIVFLGLNCLGAGWGGG